ncbi:hypothetical protein GCM10028803_18170 [Larkinella knui]|nr:lipocalin family protein [Larkinella knui]
MKHYLLITTLFMATLLSCSKSDDPVTPDTTNLLLRKWTFSEVSVKTDAKTYKIPADGATFFGEDNTVTFNKDNTYSTVEAGKTVNAGTWKLSNSNKTLTLTDIDKITTDMTVNTLTSTNIELATASVSMAKANPSPEELNIAFVAGFLLYSTDKAYGGTVDFTKEPEPKSLQVLLKGKAL